MKSPEQTGDGTNKTTLLKEISFYAVSKMRDSVISDRDRPTLARPDRIRAGHAAKRNRHSKKCSCYESHAMNPSPPASTNELAVLMELRLAFGPGTRLWANRSREELC